MCYTALCIKVEPRVCASIVAIVGEPLPTIESRKTVFSGQNKYRYNPPRAISP